MKRFAFLLLAGTLAAAGPPPGAAAPKAGVTEARRELDAAERAVAEVRKQLAAARKDAARAERDVAKASEKLKAARQSVGQRQAERLGLDRVTIAREQARQAMMDRQGAVEKETRARGDYQATAQQAEVASVELRSLRENTALTDDQRRQRHAELSAMIRQPADRLRATYQADTALRAAMQEFSEADTRLSRVQAELRDAVAKDAATLATTKQLDDATADLDQARRTLERELKAEQAAEARVERERRQLQQAQSPPRQPDQKKSDKQ